MTTLHNSQDTFSNMTNKTHSDIQKLSEDVQQASSPFSQLRSAIHEVIVGQDELLHRMFIGLLANGHLLIEGVPGLAKTLAVSSLAKGINTSFQRLQFTPDLLPADLTGTLMYRQDKGEFVVNKGPIFSSIILADEINRAPAKVQSALLEAMQERQVTIGTETFALPDPFLVLATMNPIEQEGTYPLPEAQVDRFMLKVVVDYPNKSEELEILQRMAKTTQATAVDCVMQSDSIAHARTLVDQIYVDDKIAQYIVELIQTSRTPEIVSEELAEFVEYGASPRATLALTLCAKANAFLDGRGYVVPQDVKDLAHDVLRHRIATTYEAEAEGKTSDDVVTSILDFVPVP
ncbi:MAG TPA: MoxR family ATPase [Phycisphaerales bacterium]|jgi:MoxR-like ATPase|nr:MoxR family ATPase [Phycisphaerales bacterium]